MKLSYDAKKALRLGTLCSVAYLAVYIARNILGAVSPAMIESGLFTTQNIGTMSSLYFISYAVGQLINGIVGDKIKAKYMMSLGLIFAGICNVLFGIFVHSLISEYIIYTLSGFFLSMIYGPMTKAVSENTSLKYATRCSLGYTFSSFIGSPIAGVLAAVLLWVAVFYLGGAILIVMGVVTLVIFSILERKGEIKYNQFEEKGKKQSSVKVLIKNDIIRFTLVSALTGIVRTAVVFWMPTYFSQHLGFSTKDSAMIFTVTSLIISSAAFIAIFIYEKLGFRMYLSLGLFFSLSAVCFAGMMMVKSAFVNIALITLAVIFANCASTMLWSIYCPSLSRTGMVSSATGFLDFISYMAASVSSSLFAGAVDSIGWGNLILVWLLLMAIGLPISIKYKKEA